MSAFVAWVGRLCFKRLNLKTVFLRAQETPFALLLGNGQLLDVEKNSGCKVKFQFQENLLIS